MRRFEELCDLIAIEQDVENFSALVTELNQLDPTRRLPVISKTAATTESHSAKLTDAILLLANLTGKSSSTATPRFTHNRVNERYRLFT